MKRLHRSPLSPHVAAVLLSTTLSLVLAVASFAAPGASSAPRSESELRSMLGDTGMTPEQLRARLREAGQSDEAIEGYLRQAQGSARTSASATPSRTTTAEPPISPQQTAPTLRAGSAEADSLEPFGFEIFHFSPTTFEPLSYGPVDADYPLGPGDELALTLWGDSQLSSTLAVNREGFVTLPDVGQVSVAGLTLEEARARIRGALSRVYSGLRPAGQHSTTFVSLSTGKLRTIQVFLLGQVTRPGSYTISSVSRVLNALYAAGGPSRDGSLREVRILRAGHVAATVDLYDVVLGGAAAQMPRLQNGDVVFVPHAERRITVSGSVRRPGVYELREGEQMQAVVRLAGGLLPEAERERAQIDRIVPPAQRDSLRGQGRVAVDVPLGALMADSTRDVAVLDADKLSVFTMPDRRTNTVHITGRGVNRPGVYQWKSGMRVADLIALAGGPTEDAWLEHAQLTRSLPDSSRLALRFSPAGALRGEANDNLELLAMDDLSIRSRWDLQEREQVTVHGLVRSPGTYELLDGMTLADLLMRAGGLKDDAFALRAELARVASGTRLADTLSIALGADIAASAAGSVRLQRHDAVFIRRDPDFIEQRFVTVDGEVKFPGTYALMRRDERVSDLVRRAGGLTTEAYARGATFLRVGGAHLALDLPRAIRQERAADNLVLQAGDTLRVPRFNPTVAIQGAVLTPVTALYQQGAGVGWYITQASGFRTDADRRAVVVISPAGRVQRGGRPEPGSRIIVPARPPEEKHDRLKDFATLMSVLASAATTIYLVGQSTK